MKLILDAKSYEYRKLKEYFGAQNKDHLIYLLIEHSDIKGVDLNEMFEYRIGERVLDLNMKDKK